MVEMWQGKDGRAEVRKIGSADQGKRIAYFSALLLFLAS
jgi:hypothetical protein